MKLITKKIEKELTKYNLGSQENSGLDAKILVKFFNPCGRGTWLVTEAERQENGDWLFFGFVNLHEAEYGYFLLSDLESVKLPFGLKIERDLYFENKTLRDIKF